MSSLPAAPWAAPFSPTTPRVVPQATSVTPGRQVRWHVDGWLAWRPGGGLPQVAAGAPLALAYGGSQGGMLVRFDMAQSAMRPQAYLRAVHSPDRPRQSDLAMGLSARPVAPLPVRLQAELRATRTAGGVATRPAILAVSEASPVDLPLQFRAEGYAQAGWVGGRYATGFVDGQARIDRELASMGAAKFRLGMGAWGGAQKFAGRLDVGPTATLDLREGALPARLSVDYRHRVLGNARPDSGVAVTLSTGF